MADGVQLNGVDVAGGVKAVAADVTFSGETMYAQGVFLGVLSGSADAYTYNLSVGGAGAVTAGTPRMTLASDDPAVVALQVIDDWDESDRCKVNPIVGSAGVAGGSGVVGATTQRVVLATDVGLPAGTNAIGKLTANSGVDIGDVDVLTIGGQAPTFGSGTIAAGTQRVCLATNDEAVDSLAQLEAATGTDGAASVPTKVIMIGGHEGLTTYNCHIIRAHSDDQANSQNALVVATYGYLFDGTTWDRARGTATDGMLVNLGSNNDVTVTGTVTISGAVTNAGTFAVQESGTALTRLTDIETNTDSGAVVGNGAAATAQRVTIANDSTGILAGVTTVTTLTTLANGQTAHDSAITGSPLRVGARAETSLSGITLVADGDATDLYAGVDGVLITRPHANLEDISSGVAAITDGSSTSVIAAAGAGVKTYVTSIIIANSSSSNVTVDIRDGAAGTVKATFPVPANGGVVHAFSVPLGFSANTAVCADPSAAASTVTVTMVGFKSKV